MWLYLVLLAAPVAAAIAGRLTRRGAAWTWLAILAALFLFVGFRRQIGCDWNNYLLYLNRAAELPLLQAVALSDPGYMLLNWIAPRLGLGLWAVYAVCAALLVAGLVQVARREPLPALALLAATPVLVMIVGFGPVRQSAAIGLLLLSLPLWESGRKYLAAALILAAPLFHWTAFMVIPLIPLMTMRRSFATWQMAGAGLALGALAAAAHWALPGIAGMGDAQGAWLRMAPALLALAAALWLSSRGGRSQEEERIFGYLALLTTLGLVSGLGSTVTLDRIAYLALPLQVMAISRAVAALPAGWRRPGWAAVAAFYLVFFAGWLAFTTQKQCFLPYRSYLADTEYLIRQAPEPYWLGEGLGGYHPGLEHPGRK
jgi:hypothetical protein